MSKREKVRLEAQAGFFLGDEASSDKVVRCQWRDSVRVAMKTLATFVAMSKLLMVYTMARDGRVVRQRDVMVAGSRSRVGTEPIRVSAGFGNHRHG